MFKSYYDYSRFRYIHKHIVSNPLFNTNNTTLIPKTACFFSDVLDVYIDTSDGVNDDLQITEYCARILSCIRMSKGKKFLFFKAAYSPVWSKKIVELAQKNNGKVIPFFKWSFNDNFYSSTLPNIKSLRAETNSREKTNDIGLFADFSKKYEYPKSSASNALISHSDHKKFEITGTSVNTGFYKINSRPNILQKIDDSSFSVLCKALHYKKYMQASMSCVTVLNPPGIGEYTSRMMDQTAIGNLIVLRKNTYDNGNSWKNHIPEIDFNSENWQNDYQNVLDSAKEWREKCLFYYDNLWSSTAVYNYLIEHIEREL